MSEANLFRTRDTGSPADFRQGDLVVLDNGPAGPRLFRVFDVVTGTIPQAADVRGILVGHVMLDGGDWSASLRAHILTGPVALVVGVGPAPHNCPDCIRNGGIGFACGHLINGVTTADTCQWCQDKGYVPGQPIPPRDAAQPPAFTVREEKPVAGWATYAADPAAATAVLPAVR